MFIETIGKESLVVENCIKVLKVEDKGSSSKILAHVGDVWLPVYRGTLDECKVKMEEVRMAGNYGPLRRGG